MGTVYLDHHTVDFTPELWEFAKSFEFEPSMVPLLLNPVYDTIEFHNIYSDVVNRIVVKTKRLDRDHVWATVDAHFPPKVRNGRTAGWRTMLKMDMRADITEAAETYGEYFDLRGNIMPQGHVDATRLGLVDEVADVSQYAVNAYVFVQQVLRFRPQDLEEFEEELPVKEVKHQKKKSKKSRSPVVATTRTYRSYRIKKDYDFSERNPIVRQCRLWLVRGHERHLPNGRVINIDPYYKGVDREFARPEDGDFGRQIKVKPVEVM